MTDDRMAAAREVVLPVVGEENVLITSALPYVNNVPHLGNIVGSVLSADIFARYSRARGKRTIYVCGSDEYGTATETKALEVGVTPEELCKKYHAIHKEIYDFFRIEFDIFGRTPTPQHTDIVQDVFSKLWGNGFIEEREIAQAYCPSHNSFLADRFIEGECSLCHDLGARGDQCDKCGNLLDPLPPETTADGKAELESSATGYLINSRCKLDGTTPEKRLTKHLYLRLDALSRELESWLEGASKQWSANCIAITNGWTRQGLKPRGITRDLKWGVPVPKGLDGLSEEDYCKKVFYVWFDACIGYPSITRCYTDGDDLSGKKWEQWWKNPEHVKLYQFMGKDNVPFHSIIFPASQIGSRDNWTKLSRLSTTDYLNYEGGKFSKSKNIGVFGNQARDTGIDPDIWRFYLAFVRPEAGDTEFKWDDFIEANNCQLLKNLGNFCNRAVKFCQSKLDAKIPDYTVYTDSDSTILKVQAFKDEVNQLLKTTIGLFEAIKLRQALATILLISNAGNKLLQDNKMSNQLLEEDPIRCAAVIGLALNLLHLLANLISPYMPEKSKLVLEQLGVRESKFFIPETFTGDVLKPGQPIGEPKLLFSNIATAKVEEWRNAFGGDELRKLKALEAEKAAAKKVAKEKEKEKKKAKKVAQKKTETKILGEMAVLELKESWTS